MSAAASPAANSTLRVAVIGAGHWGPNLIANFRDDPRSEVVWVIDSDAARREAVRVRFDELRYGDDAAVAINDPDVDAVVVATPTRTHYALARAALEAGKHVLVEKPLTATVSEAEALCELVESSDRTLLVGHVFLYNAGAREAKRIIERGELGRIYYLSMERTNLGPIRVDVNAAWDLAAHDISLASYWLEAEPFEVSASGGAWINPGVEDVVFATLRYPQDILVHVHASWLHPRKAREIAIVGERRMLTFDDTDAEHPLHLFDKNVESARTHPMFADSFESFRMSVHEGEVTAPEVVMQQPLKNECVHFLDCVLDAQQPLTGPRMGLGVVRVLDAISRSLEAGGRVVAVASS